MMKANAMKHSSPSLKGIIFDLDGTLVRSSLDFDQIRRELGIEGGRSILEHMDSIGESERVQCEEVLHRHEWEGARRAILMEGSADFIASVREKGVPLAVLTRNSRDVSEFTLERVQVSVDLLICREDGPPKPDPAGLIKICQVWSADPNEVVFFGDYRFDLEAGRRAGVKTVLYVDGERPIPSFGEEADSVIHHFDQAWEAIQRLGYQFK